MAPAHALTSNFEATQQLRAKHSALGSQVISREKKSAHSFGKMSCPIPAVNLTSCQLTWLARTTGNWALGITREASEHGFCGLLTPKYQTMIGRGSAGMSLPGTTDGTTVQSSSMLATSPRPAAGVSKRACLHPIGSTSSP